MKEFIGIILTVLLVVALVIGTFKLVKFCNYKMYYENSVKEQVDQAIQEHVKQYHQPK